jgi:hypothetical protein
MLRTYVWFDATTCTWKYQTRTDSKKTKSYSEQKNSFPNLFFTGHSRLRTCRPAFEVRLNFVVMPLLPRPGAVRHRPAAAGADLVLRRPAAAVPVQLLTGPVQVGGSRAGQPRRQYCWWITFSFPYPETVRELGLRTPAAFSTRESFADACRQVHLAAGIDLVEMAIAKEFHERRGDDGQRLPHYDALVRSPNQYSWRGITTKFWELYKMRVDFADHIKSWYDGVVYMASPSEHKPPEELDLEVYQWGPPGAPPPTPLRELLPQRLRSGLRTNKMSHLQAYDVCTEHNARTAADAWALAKRRDAEGDRGLLGFFLESRDVEGFVNKCTSANDSADMARRKGLGRIGVLREAAARDCTCDVGGQWLDLAHATLDRNGVRSQFQQAVYRIPEQGRAKKNNLFLLGPPNAGKSFVLQPLTVLFRSYAIPDDGSHQLEHVLDKEVAYLNDFTWDEKWLQWSYLKTKQFHTDNTGQRKVHENTCASICLGTASLFLCLVAAPQMLPLARAR